MSFLLHRNCWPLILAGIGWGIRLDLMSLRTVVIEQSSMTASSSISTTLFSPMTGFRIWFVCALFRFFRLNRGVKTGN